MRTPYMAPDGTKVSIEYEEDANRWNCVLNEEHIRAESLAKLKEKIDRRLSPKAKARKVPCFYTAGYSDRLREGSATSLTDDAYFVRVSPTTSEMKRPGSYGGTRQREQVNKNVVYAHSPTNVKLVEQITALSNEQAALNKKERTLREKLTPFDIDLLRDES